MSTTTAITAPPLTADEFLAQFGDQYGVELVDGQIVRFPTPGAKHGEICVNAAMLIGSFVKERRLGRLLSNDTFVRTQTDPARFRGADLIFLSYAILPQSEPTPVGAITSPVELIVEVRSPSDSVISVTSKASEYLNAGVRVVLLLDPELEAAAVFRSNEYPQRFSNGDELTLPDILPGFAVPVKRFFE